MKRIKAEVPAIRFIDQELGQLEMERPAVSWPCVLIDVDSFQASQLAGEIQIMEGDIVLRLGFPAYSGSSSLTPDQWRTRGLAFYELEWQIHKALHGWRAEGFNSLCRVSVGGEQREDNIRVRVMRYSVTFEDRSAVPPVETFGGLTDFSEDFAFSDFGGSLPTLVVTS